MLEKSSVLPICFCHIKYNKHPKQAQNLKKSVYCSSEWISPPSLNALESLKEY